MSNEFGQTGRYKGYSSEDFAMDEDFQRWVLTPDDNLRQFWFKFLSENPFKQEDVNQAISLVKLSGLSTNQEANEAYLAGWSLIEQTVSKSRVAKRRKIGYAAIAASILVVATISLYLSTGSQPVQIYQTALNETKECKLVDGSVVTLNGNSTLQVLYHEANGERIVKLSGEAFFKVTHLSDQKNFQVLLPNNISVEVLGTAFNVLARKEKTSVYLQSGSVKLYAANGISILKPGQEGTITAGDPKFIVQDVKETEAESTLAWKIGTYIMNDVSLRKVAEHIEEQFGIPVVIQDPMIADRRITAKVPSQNLDVLLRVISEGLSIQVENKNGRILIRDL